MINEDINDLILERDYCMNRALDAEVSRDYWKRWSETLNEKMDKLQTQILNHKKCPFAELLFFEFDELS